MVAESERFFTLEEVHRLLPDLEVRIARFLEKKTAYMRMHDHLLIEELLEDIERRKGALERGQSEHEAGKLELAVSDLEREITELQRLGCLLYDLEKGWVDFPASHGGARVYFCWKWGEKTVRFYRLAGASAGRERMLLDGKPAKP